MECSLFLAEVECSLFLAEVEGLVCSSCGKAKGKHYRDAEQRERAEDRAARERAEERELAARERAEVRKFELQIRRDGNQTGQANQTPSGHPIFCFVPR
jgi:hypothetical protein